MSRLIVHSLWSRKRRLLATCTAVVLGVAFLAAHDDLRRHRQGRLPERAHVGERRY